jgi:hypothetical protein
MVNNVLLDNIPSHSVSDCAHEISILPQLPAPQSLFQTRELAKQSPPDVAFDNPNDLPYRSRWRERDQEMNVFFHDFHFQNLDAIRPANLLDHLPCSFPDLGPLEDVFPVFGAPGQMVRTVVARMTRPFERHALYIAYQRARAYAD